MEATAHSIPSPVEKWLADCDERGHYTLERGKEQKKNEGGCKREMPKKGKKEKRMDGEMVEMEG